ncbi:hypothetical protein [Bacteroides sp. 224]|uniref:hypothetical protein n=1 Tax=Bacteroides sp. 224 TaxID=2302936 RepID=UPI0013D35FE5|nr:hypothetical protein [Bacteroides sp. 224]NDV67249.1 hypothetical protein [Bacteroides sp. 224]
MQKKVHRFYSETFKLEVLRDHYSCSSSLNFTVRKWGLSSNSLLLSWIRRYPLDSKFLSLDIETISCNEMGKSKKSKEAVLQEQILNLKKALEMEKLRSRAFETLIEITEKEEGISILKKDGAKQ